MKIKADSILKTYRQIYSHIPRKRQKVIFFLFLIMLAVALLETLSAGVLAVFASTLSSTVAASDNIITHFLSKVLPASLLKNTANIIFILSIVVVLSVVFKNVVGALSLYGQVRYSTWLSAYLGEKQLAGFLQLPYEEFINKNSADLVLATEWRNHVGKYLISILQFCNDFLMIAAMFAALIISNPLVSLAIVLLTSFVSGIFYFIFRKTIDINSAKIKDLTQSANKMATRALHGLKDVRITGKEKYFVKDFKTDAYKLGYRLALQRMLINLPSWIIELMGFMLIAGAIFFMNYILHQTSAKIVGLLSFFAIVAWRVLPAFSRLMQSQNMLRTTLPMVRKFLDHLKDSKVPENPATPKQVEWTREIVFKDLFFKYINTDKYVLKNVNLSIKKGEAFGIIGKSGCGKSTLADIILGLLRPSAGQVMLDETPLDEATLASWLGRLGYVPQTPYIFDGTLAENVAFGYSGAEIDRKQVLESCRKASLLEFVEELPEGIDTGIGERGVLISGGQRQRIAIARALYGNPEILILDEATSSLDMHNERLIQETIRKIKHNITIIVIAHKMETIKDCDRVIWLKDGEIFMGGEPAKVLARY